MTRGRKYLILCLLYHPSLPGQALILLSCAPNTFNTSVCACPSHPQYRIRRCLCDDGGYPVAHRCHHYLVHRNITTAVAMSSAASSSVVPSTMPSKADVGSTVDDRSCCSLRSHRPYSAYICLIRRTATQAD